jgi:hypothetical protein
MSLLMSEATKILQAVKSVLAKLGRAFGELRPYRPEQHYMRGRKDGGGGPSTAAHG